MVITCFNTQPPEGGCKIFLSEIIADFVSTHSHPKVAAVLALYGLVSTSVSTHSHPKVAARPNCSGSTPVWFQHTATRRWLPPPMPALLSLNLVSTHSHPKVAAQRAIASIENLEFQHTATRRWLPVIPTMFQYFCGFNTQPPEGGCRSAVRSLFIKQCFNTQPPEGGCFLLFYKVTCNFNVSTHSHPKVAAPWHPT